MVSLEHEPLKEHQSSEKFMHKNNSLDHYSGSGNPDNAPKVPVLLLLGGTSEIGLAIARCFVVHGWSVQLAGRDLAALAKHAQKLAGDDPDRVSIHALDILRSEDFEVFIAQLPVLPDVVVCAVGILGNQTQALCDLVQSTSIMRANYEGPALLMGLFAESFCQRGSGALIGVSSVAGERGRAGNYIYGSAKAGFSAFMSGLRARLAAQGLYVMTVKPGPVRTRMMAGRTLFRPLTAEADEVGRAVYRAYQKRREVIYVKPIWGLLMAVIRALPERLFKKIKI